MSGLQRTSKLHQHGFTIVELLIVVVVIAILAAVILVAYNGITDNAKAAALKTNLSQATTKLETYKIDNNAYPPDQATVASLLNLDPSTVLTYATNNSTSTPAYCLIAIKDSLQFSVSSVNNTPSTNGCIINLSDRPIPDTASQSDNIQWRLVGTYWPSDSTSTIETGGWNGYAYLRKTITTTNHPTSSGTVVVGSNPDGNVPSPSITPGATYALSFWFRSSVAGNYQLYFRFRDASGAVVGDGFGPSIAVSAGTWARLSMVTQAPQTAATMQVRTNGNPPDNIGDTFDSTALLVTQGSTLYNYADGNSPSWIWSGTPNISMSFGPAL